MSDVRPGPISVDEWLFERLANSLRIAGLKSGADREGWLEDARYYRAIIDDRKASPPSRPPVSR